MFDPEHDYDEHIARELRVCEKLPISREVELKYLLNRPSTFQSIVNHIDERQNRHVAPHTYEEKPHALVTYNLDTKDRLFYQNGLSVRTRFSYNPYAKNPQAFDIDLTVKTRLSDYAISYKDCERGEWEAILPNLTPDLSEISKQNPEPSHPIPDLILNGDIPSNSIYVESVGVSWRSTFSSGHRLPNTDLIVIYDHTEDANLFNSPLCLPVHTLTDTEAEAERKAILCPVNQHYNDQLDTLLDTSLKRTNQLLLPFSRFGSLNMVAKSARAGLVTENVWEELYEAVSNQQKDFNIQAGLAGVQYALSLGIKPTEVPIHNMAHEMRKLKAQKDTALSSKFDHSFELAA
jgi:hypothetical protein